MRDRAAGKKRKRSVGTPTASPLDVVVACLRGDQAALEAALGVERRGGALLPGCRFPQLAESSVAGCRPLDAAVIGNSPGCIRLLATIVDVDAPLEVSSCLWLRGCWLRACGAAKHGHAVPTAPAAASMLLFRTKA